MHNYTLHHQLQGTGKPVVFLHGFLEDSTMWKPIIQGLTPIQSLCIDLPGHGKSLLPEELSLEIMTDFVVDLLKRYELEDVVIVGHSLGGYIALHLAERKDITINQVVLLHSHPWADEGEKKTNRTRAARVVEYDKMLFIREAIPNLYHLPLQEKHAKDIDDGIELAQKMSTEAIIQNLLAMRDREEKTEVLKEWGDKLHIIQGEFDSLINTEEIRSLTKRHNNNFYLISGIGHMGHQEAPEIVISYLQEVIDHSMKDTGQ